MNKKKILVFIISFVCTLIYAGPINWAVSMTSFPSDQNIGDSGQEKIPNGYVDLMAGNLVFDIPEVTLKGDRGLDFTLSRSYGKVNNGFRSMGNWELESPRLVMMTGASTQLQGDYNGQGICQSNGDYNNNQSGDAVFNTSIIDSGYKNEIKSSYVELANINYLKRIASALTNVSPQKAGDLGTTELYTVNKEGAKNILNGLMFVNSDNDGSKVSQQLESMTQNLVNKNKAYIEAYKFNLATSFGLMNTLVKVNNITKMEIRYTSGKTVIIEVPYIYTYELGGRLFSARLIKALADPDIATQNFTLLLYNGSKAITSLKGLSANNDLPISQLMPLFYTVNYVQISLSLMNLTWAYSENGVETIPKPFAWDSTDLFTPTLNEANTTIWRIKTREKSTSDFELYSKVDPRQRPMSLYIPGQKNITFYPVDGATQYPASTKYASQDNWIISCENSGNDFRVRSPNGMTYLFPKDNRENQTGFPTLFGNQYIPGRVTIHASKVENQFGEAYQLSYQKIENTNRTYDGYNNSSKFFLEKVFHQLDGNNVSSNPDLILTYGKFAASGIVSTAFDDFKNNVGDIVVTGINRYVNNKYIPWKKYQ
ncbi:RHS repeat protein, partial [Acinetobacter gerneri]